MKRIQKFLRLSIPDKLLLIHAFVVLTVVMLGLRVLPWLVLQRVLLKLANGYSRFRPAQRPSAQHIAWTVQAASRYVPKATCLPRALAAQLLLIQRAYPADLQIGVARDENGKLEAHAWVTSNDGIIIGGVPDPDRFVPLSHMEKQSMEDYVSAA